MLRERLLRERERERQRARAKGEADVRERERVGIDRSGESLRVVERCTYQPKIVCMYGWRWSVVISKW
jgi:hypothetical protein